MLNGLVTLIALKLLLKGSNNLDVPVGKDSEVINLSCLSSNLFLAVVKKLGSPLSAVDTFLII